MITSLFYAIPAFKQLNFPVGTFERQLSFNEIKLQEWLKVVEDGNRIQLIAIQHNYDDWFALSLGLSLLFLGMILADIYSKKDFIIWGVLGIIGGILDLVENRIFLNMAANIQGIDSSSAILFSFINLFKWSLYAFSILGFIFYWINMKKSK
jgi:hypothetical protein